MGRRQEKAGLKSSFADAVQMAYRFRRLTDEQLGILERVDEAYD
jgi:hypothetical protein